MTLDLTEAERETAQRDDAAGLALRVVAEAARLLGAERLIPIASAHIDGCLYHGDAGVAFADRLVEGGGRVAVPTTLNVGALDLLHPDRVQAAPARQAAARRQMAAYTELGCRPTWTCAPYQAGHRPAAGEDVAWGESNAVAFCNSVLGARTNRYGDLLDICCALAGRAPDCGLHRPENRRATVLIETEGLSAALKDSEVFYPVLGAWLGAEVGSAVPVVTGLPADLSEDRLKALGAAAASTGAVGLFHVAGVTPEAPSVEAALDGRAPERRIAVTPEALRQARDRLSTSVAETVDAVALGSPHFSYEEFGRLEAALKGREIKVPFYVCTGRHAVERLEAEGRLRPLEEAGVTLVTDTCVVVTPILPRDGGVLMTNSGKFAHYAPGTIGYGVVYGSLEDCVATAASGRVTRDESLWR